MKIKSLILIFVILGFSVSLIQTASAISLSQHDNSGVISHKGIFHENLKDTKCYQQNSKKCKYYGYSQMMIKIKGKSSELSKLKKINVKINGKTIKNYKNDYKVKKTSISFNAFKKGDIQNKKYTITAYDKYNKIIKTRKGRISIVWTFALEK